MELVDLYDETACLWAARRSATGKRDPGEYRVVVHVCVFDHQGRLLIQQRTPEKILWPDRWDVSIGGGWMPGRPAVRPRSGSSGRNWDIPWTLREAGPL